MAASAGAQDSAAVAEALFQEGRAAMELKDYETACRKLRESDRIDPQPGTKLNLASCEEARGKLATAWALYRAVVDAVPPTDDRRPEAQARADAVGPRVPKLVLALEPGAPPNTRVKIGALTVEAAAFGAQLPIDPGETVLEVDAPGRRSAHIAVRADEGTTRTVTVAPGPPLPATTVRPRPAAPVPEPAPPADRGISSQAAAGWAIGAIGLAALIAGSATGIAGLERKGAGDDLCDAERGVCDQDGADAHDAARKLLTTTTVCWIVGGVAFGTGLVLVLTAPSGDEPSAALRVGPTGASVLVRY
jgi:hypothetical protein